MLMISGMTVCVLEAVFDVGNRYVIFVSGPTTESLDKQAFSTVCVEHIT